MLRSFSLLTFLLLTAPAFAQFSNLTVTPTHPTAGLQLNWTGPGGTININRWTDAAPTPVTIDTTTGMTYTDTTPAANTIYYYSVSQGAASSNTFMGVVSDITQAFNCPPMVAIDPSLLGVDRTESFTAADGTTVSFTIHAPIPANVTTIYSVPPCAGAGGCSDLDNINNAINSAIAGGGGTVQLSAGDYHLDCRITCATFPAGWSSATFNYNISLGAGADVILAGANVSSGAEPTTHLFFNQTTSLAGSVDGIVTGGSRKLVRNITFDWDFPTAIPGTLETLTPTDCGARLGLPNCQLFHVTDGSYYVPDPTNPPPVYIMDAYNFTGRTYDLRAGGRGAANPCTPPATPCPFNPNFASDGLYYFEISPQLNLILFPDTTTAIMIVKTGVMMLPGTDAFDQSFENTRIYGGGGPGLIQGPHSQGLRLSNFVIERKPDALLQPGEQPRYTSTFGDSDSNGSQGNVLIENSQFGLVEDDTWYSRGAVFQLQKLTSTNSFTIDAGLVINHAPPGSNDFFKFMDPYSYKQIGSTTPLVTWTKAPCQVPRQCTSGTLWHFTFPDIPELATYIGLPSSLLPWFGEPLWSAPNLVIRNTCSHDTHGRMLALSWNGLVENNVLANGYFGPIVASNNVALPGLPTSFGDGPGAQNIIYRNNKVIGANYGQTDLKTIWSPVVKSNGFPQTGWGQSAISAGAGVGADGFYPLAVAAKNFAIQGNFISNTPGLCILVTSTTNVKVTGNICVDANAVPFADGFDSTFCGGNSKGWQASGANQPWCLAKTAAQGTIMLVNVANADSTSTPNVFLGTSLGSIFTFDSSTVMRTDIINGPLFH